MKPSLQNLVIHLKDLINLYTSAEHVEIINEKNIEIKIKDTFIKGYDKNMLITSILNNKKFKNSVFWTHNTDRLVLVNLALKFIIAQEIIIIIILENENFESYESQLITDIFLSYILKNLKSFTGKRSSSYDYDYEHKRQIIIGDLQELDITVIDNYDQIKSENINTLYQKYGFIGYDNIKELIYTNILFPWENKKTFQTKASKQFTNIKNIIPNAILFYGPPGTGKTTMARIISEYLDYCFVYISTSAISSYNTQKDQLKFDKIFDSIGVLAKIQGGIIVFIDEIEDLGKKRSESHRSDFTTILLKKLDSLEKINNILLIGSTNRKDDIDEALLNRFSYILKFNFPLIKDIKEIINYYLPNVDNLEDKFINNFQCLSGRSISIICESASRMYITYQIQKKNISIQECLIKAAQNTLKIS